jgi:inorganic pyrophosphatase
MSNLMDLSAFDKSGRLRMVVETPRGSSIKFKYEPDGNFFTVSRGLSLGVTYPFDWGFIPGTRGEDGDPIDAIAIHDCASFPGVVLPCECIGVLHIDQRSAGGRIGNPRLILSPTWRNGLGVFEKARHLADSFKKEIEQFFLNATLFTDKDARVAGWGEGDEAGELIRKSLHQGDPRS